ncbi:MAG: type II toxin-antitoxin system RelE/ParE family toxin [Candidatus Cloacimonetes bacterium]|nr:type II toxin-antitoxin system RelE/ParE family toxin [Candidatus Cloacimonadota bacterium]
MTKYIIIISEIAKEEIEDAYNYIKEKLNNSQAAEKMIIQIREKLDCIEENPYIWPLVNDFHLSSLGVRFFRVKNYLLFYVIDKTKKTVKLSRFLFGRSDWLSLLHEDLIEE